MTMPASIEAALDGATVLDATKASIAAAQTLTSLDAGAVAVLLRLAEQIDAIDEYGLNPAGKLDNVSVPTYLKYASALGLTMEGRKAPDSGGKAAGGAPSGTQARRERAAQRQRKTAAVAA